MKIRTARENEIDEILKWCINEFSNIKIDTHKNNIPMQKLS